MLFLYTIIFISFFYILLVPPKEFISSGLTVNNILSSFLDEEIDNFINYQIKRTSLFILFYSLIPTFYLIGYKICLSSSDELSYVNIPTNDINQNNNYDLLFNDYAQIILFIVSIITFCISLAWVYYASLNKWSNHPIAKNLSLYSSDNAIDDLVSRNGNEHQQSLSDVNNEDLVVLEWKTVADSVNQEFKAIDKLSSNMGNMIFYLTNSWMIKVSTFRVDIVQKNDVQLSLAKAKDHTLSHISDFGAQILEIKVEPIHKQELKSFYIRLSSMEYSYLREAIHNPIQITENIVIKQSLADRFVEVFREVMVQNPPYVVPISTVRNVCNRTLTDRWLHFFWPDVFIPEGLENCLGCLAKLSDVKLRKNCNAEECKTCYCRPMWCSSCMAKWFASRQDPKNPETWLSGKSPCPLCRSVFCVLDVCTLVTRDIEG